MQDRFRFRVWNKENKEMIYNAEIAYEGMNYNTSWQLGKNTNDSWVDCFGYYLDYPRDYEVMQCTGLKDKNGKLIYEGDIIKYAEFDWTDFSYWETEIAQVVWGNTYDNYYPAFDLKDTDFDGTNAFAYLFNEGWTIEVIGNVYQNPELLED